MTGGETLLVTGVAGPWGRSVARRLLAAGHRVIGVDRHAPAEPPPGLDVVIADIAHPRFADFLRQEEVDAICHLAFRPTQQPSERAFQANVMGTMRLAGAAAAAGVRRLVVRSSTAVYGARYDNPLYLTEDAPLRAARHYGYLRDWLEVEHFLASFRVNSDLEVTLLRLASPLGHSPLSPLGRLLQQPVAPTLLGFNPLLQVLAAEDAFDVFVHATNARVTGAFNIAAPGAMPLSKVLALAGVRRVPLLHPLAYRGARWLSGFREGQYLFPLPPDYLRYPWLADTGGMRERLGFTPQHSGDAAVRRLAGTAV